MACSKIVFGCAVLKLLLEKQADDPSQASDGKGDDEPQKRYLILVSTIMTWASTKPLDPVTVVPKLTPVVSSKL